MTRLAVLYLSRSATRASSPGPRAGSARMPVLTVHAASSWAELRR